MEQLDSEKYISLTTYTKDGRAKPTPVWFASLNGEGMCIVTEKDSWKVKRIQRNPAVELAVCDSRGAISSEASSIGGRAKIVGRNTSEFESTNLALTRKYGLFYRLFSLVARIRGKESCAIFVTLDTTA